MIALRIWIYRSCMKFGRLKCHTKLVKVFKLYFDVEEYIYFKIVNFFNYFMSKYEIMAIKT